MRDRQDRDLGEEPVTDRFGELAGGEDAEDGVAAPGAGLAEVEPGEGGVAGGMDGEWEGDC